VNTDLEFCLGIPVTTLKLNLLKQAKLPVCSQIIWHR